MRFSIPTWLGRMAAVIIASVFLAACNPLESKAKAGLQVETGETAATLFLDGQYLERTPFINKEIKPGRYTLKIQPDDPKLVSYETELNLRKGLLTVVTWIPGPRPEQSGGVIYELEKIPENKTSELTIVTIPDAAIVTVQGREKEFAPLAINPIESGEKEYEVSLPSYDTQRHTVNLLPGYRTTITVKLAKSTFNPDSLVSDRSVTSSNAASGSATASPSATLPTVVGSKVVIKPTNFFQDGKEVLRVRSSVGASSETLGFAPVGAEYQYTGQAQAGWYQIIFQGKNGWVSGQYVTVLP